MRYISDWVAEWVEGTMPSAQEAEETLTDLGLEVERVLQDQDVADRVVIGQVITKAQHPNADRLTLCQVDVGEAEHAQIVCGAPNHQEGDRVVVARPGCRLPGDFKIKRSKIRGEVSEGMMCSEKELGLGEADEGIWILPSDAPIGQTLGQYVRAGGRHVFELGLTANRGDALSMVGIARELCLRSDQRSPRALIEACASAGEPADVTVDLSDSGCPFYAAKLLRNVRVGASPLWLQQRLQAAGVRAISNVVDITNYVLLTYGQPLHAFDYALLGGGARCVQMGVRSAEPGETLATLDGVTRKLAQDDLVVTESGRAVALAGVMGGAETEVSSETTEVLLEAAFFDPSRVRVTARRHALHSESSHRFERHVDPARVLAAMNFAAQLMVDLCGAEAADGYADAGSLPTANPPIRFRFSDAEALIGMAFDPDESAQLLERLGCLVDRTDTALWTVQPPTWRRDLERSVDLIEELVRGKGLDAVPERLPDAPPPPAGITTADPTDALGRSLSLDLIGRGYFEAVSLAFMSPTWAERCARSAIELDNPLGEETRYLRTDLRPALVEAVSLNRRHGRVEVRLVECARRFEREVEHNTIAWTAPWGDDPVTGYAACRGELEALLGARGVAQLRYKPMGDADRLLHPRSAARVLADDQVIGTLGEVHPELRNELELTPGQWLVQLDLSATLVGTAALSVYEPLPRFPAVHRDLALVVDEAVGAGHLADLAQRVDASLAVHARVFDVYRGKGLSEGKKSVAVRFSIQSAEGTLSEKEANRWLKRYQELALDQFGAQLRG